MMFRDSQWINSSNVTKSKKNKNKRRHTDPSTSETSSSSSGQRSDNDEITINSFNDSLPPSDSKELRNIEGGEYFLPSADKNIERLQMQHYLFSKCVWRSNHSSPVEEIFAPGGTSVLDVQCGSGIWMSDLATEYPNSTFVGIDDDADRARIEIPLPNAAFLHHNLMEGLPFPDDTFDFVHQRFFTSVNETDWQEYILPDMVRVLKPGGWIELMELSPFSNAGHMTKKMFKAYDEFNLKLGIHRLDPSVFQKGLTSIKSINPKSIRSEYRITPLFGGRLSQLVCQNLFKRLELKKIEFCEFLKISESEFDETIKTMYEEVSKLKTYCKSYRVYGKKLI
ncbi:S-adenosyl-L-methionine-dependent methyltransferase [Glomus cerebriforme]|uniref:S-adenosyl-L-methionine-dependent methyltransferase n=1 Tax=Glomus cerebriforme TaxID=658196 RepID=A0A397TFY8_9GLOM|nr:S-adenosyl-L-methionine-dependent methyltransferase [Glomus cerebriforme]